MHSTPPKITLHDYEPETAEMLAEILDGLRKLKKELPCKYFYDERGSELFEEICELQEYYLTRAELAIMRRHSGNMAARLGSDCLVVEYGSGSGIKTRILLDHLERPAGYVPIDISREHLRRSAAELSAAYADLEVLPVCADFTGRFELPRPKRPAARTVVYFPGSTIGNFSPAAAEAFLRRIASLCGLGGGLLIGVDVKKSREILERAYNDSKGVTRDFNRNVLARINRELDADFQLDEFQHRALYNEDQGRVEMHLVSLRDQTVTLDDTEIRFRQGESICTEYSYKYSLEEFRALAAAAGFEVEKVWLDDDELFSVQYLTVC